MRRHRVGALVVALGAGLVPSTASGQQEIKTNEVVVEYVSGLPYTQAVAKIEAAFKAGGLVVIGEPNYQMMQRMVGRERRGAKAYFVFRPDLGTPVFDADYNAALEIPMKILLYEREDKKTTIRYFKPSVALGNYKGLGDLGRSLDELLQKVVSAALR
ncbi:MAG: DUF302 domain-containing protein [Gemmatimonadetes bacterium]|nr:DUF302 domain-containing protein [Gemmatimonadota bacterium]MBI2537361.1 DUF302 domain-containing protein [Gemmatimonadota bacterium]